MTQGVTVEAPAKVNLRLRVLAREASGYHTLESLFCAISLADTLRVERAEEPGIALLVEGEIDTGPSEENLAVRACRRFYAELGEEPALRVELVKRIPAEAGLGGGSSDGAAALRALNALHGDAFPPGLLLQWALELGSDVPFFLCGAPYALGWGRGERLLALPPLPSRPVLIANPGVAMPTRGAFARIAQQRGGAFRPEALAIPLGALTSWDGVEEVVANDFGPVAEERLPGLQGGREALEAAGARIALLAGSGASLFGVFDSAEDRDRAAGALQELGFSTWSTRTLEEMPEPEVG